MRRRLYTPTERAKAVDAGRERIISAARELLEADDAEGFSIDAVARRAGVSRMTVYNQFVSKAGLLEALFDSLAASGPFRDMPDIFADPDPLAALDRFVALFGQFWTSSRRAHSRLRAAGLLDHELAAALSARSERRRRGVAVIVSKLGARARPIVPRDEIINVLFVLLSFEAFDAFAGERRTPNDVVPVVQRIVRETLGIKARPARARRRHESVSEVHR